MKYYKLKKDLPTFKAGDEFYLDNDGNLRLKENGNIIAYHHSTLENFPDALKDWFEEIYVIKRWRAKYGEGYWYVGDNGRIYLATEEGHSADNYRFNTDNYFKTAGEAYNYRKYLIARQVLLDDTGGWKFTLKEQNYFAKYGVIDNRWHLNADYHYTPDGIYFEDLESLKKSLKEHEEQWEIVREYEMGGTQSKEVY